MEVKKLSERFLAGFYQGGTPISAKKNVNHTLQLKAKKCLGNGQVNFWDDGIAENICYVSGGICGVVLVPVDAMMVAVTGFKKTFRLE